MHGLIVIETALSQAERENKEMNELYQQLKQFQLANGHKGFYITIDYFLIILLIVILSK